MSKYALITGGASGLGKDLAELFLKDGINLFLVSSNINNLEAAKKEFSAKYNVDIQILALDLSNPADFPKVKEYSDYHRLEVRYLVNCAGFGELADFKDMDINHQLKMVELDCNCPMYLMSAYINEMLSKDEGDILNIASLASYFPGPHMSTYHACKAFLLNLSEGINRELKHTNVHIATSCPGPFKSVFVDKAHNYHTFTKTKVFTSEKIAEISYNMMKKKKDVLVIGFKNKCSVFFSRFFSRKFITNISAKMIKKGG